jgi:nucleoid DNA-binding protein
MAPTAKAIYKEVARESGLSTKQARTVLTSLQAVIARELAQGRNVNVPILAHFRRKTIPARGEITRRIFGKDVVLPPKGESKQVRVRPSKALQLKCAVELK